MQASSVAERSDRQKVELYFWEVIGVAEHYRKAERCLPGKRRIAVIVHHNQDDIEERSGLVDECAGDVDRHGVSIGCAGRSSVA
jgi:hypothetical protein